MNERHVVPAADLVAHEDSEDCVCGPRVEFVTGGKVVVHSALDAREKAEQLGPVPWREIGHTCERETLDGAATCPHTDHKASSSPESSKDSAS